jgi:hypothetical protein
MHLEIGQAQLWFVQFLLQTVDFSLQLRIITLTA